MTLLGALIVSAVLTVGLTARVAWPRLVVEEFPGPLRRGLAHAVLIVTLAVTAILPLSHIGQPPPEMSFEGIHMVELFLGHAVLATCLLLWWALAGFRPLAGFLHLRLDRPREQLRSGVLVGLGGWAITMLTMIVSGTPARPRREMRAVSPQSEVPQLVRAIVELPLLVRVALVCSAGFFEELFFRSFLQSRGGLLLSTVLFTASHASYGMPLMLVGVFAVSVVLGRVVREARRRRALHRRARRVRRDPALRGPAGGGGSRLSMRRSARRGGARAHPPALPGRGRRGAHPARARAGARAARVAVVEAPPRARGSATTAASRSARAR